jgi:hypothetical protein
VTCDGAIAAYAVVLAVVGGAVLWLARFVRIVNRDFRGKKGPAVVAIIGVGDLLGVGRLAEPMGQPHALLADDRLGNAPCP